MALLSCSGKVSEGIQLNEIWSLNLAIDVDYSKLFEINFVDAVELVAK